MLFQLQFQLQEELNKYFLREFQSKIKSVIARALNETETELLGIDARLDEFSETIQPFMQEILEEYGLRCVKFVVAALDIDDNELRSRYDEIGMDAIAKMREAQANKAVMGILGDDWGRQQAANILSDLSNNPGAGGVAAAGAGMGMGFGAAGAFGAMAQQMFAPMNNGFAPMQQVPMQQTPMQQAPMQQAPMQQAPMQQAPMQQAPMQQMPMQQAPSGRFTQRTETTNNDQSDPVEVLGKLKALLDAGLILQEEYDAKKNEILSRM